MADETKEPSTPYGEDEGTGRAKPKNPSTGEPSTPYADDGKGGDAPPSEKAPSQQPS